MDERTFVKGFSDTGFSSSASAITCHPAAPAAACKNRCETTIRIVGIGFSALR
jgi:hypothetical protein